MSAIEIQDVQKKILSIFKAVDNVCKRNNIRYYAIGGTCLGAVRHNGFIPWDDDLDIAMPRADYNKFIQIAEHELPSNLRLFGVDNIKHYECLYIKVHDINTTFIHKSYKDYVERYAGVYIDIMPLDGIADNRIMRKVNFVQLEALMKLNVNRRFGVDFYHQGSRLFMWKIINLYIQKKPYDFFSQKHCALLKSFDFDKSKYSCYGWSTLARKIIFLVSDFEDYIEIPFEDYVMRCPVGYDHFLTTMFGDYMKLPPKKEQESKHDAFIDLNRSYRYYQEHGILLTEQ